MTKRPPRFIKRTEADKRALRLYEALREIEKMPLIGFEIRIGNPKPILFWDAENPKDIWAEWSVEAVLMRDIEMAKQAGGRYQNLRDAMRRPGPMRVPQAEVDRAVESFLTGDEEESPPE